MKKGLVFAVRSRWGYPLLFVVLALVGIILTALHSYRAIDRELIDSALSRRVSVSDLAATTLSEKFDRLVDVGISLATRVRFRQLVTEQQWSEAIEILRSVPGDLPAIERLFLTDVNGTLMADLPKLPGVQGRNFAYRDWYKGVMRGGKPYVSPIYRRAAPPEVNVFAVAVPIRNDHGTVTGVLVVQVLLDTFFDWAKAIEIGPGGSIYFVDPQGHLAFHSNFAQRKEIIGFSSAAAVQQVLSGRRNVERVFDPVEKEDSVAAYTPVSRYGWGVVVQQPTQAAFATRNRQLMFLLVAYGLILFFCGLVAYLMSRIIVQRREVESDRRVKVELERRVAERTAQLEATNKELESFTYSVSHDLRSPLRAVDGFSKILGEDYADKLDDEGRRLLRIIQENSQKMGQLIDDLLAFSRLGRKPIAAVEIDMTALAQEVAKELRAMPGAAALECRVGQIPAAWGDRSSLRQVWINLLSNAVKFSQTRARPSVEVSGSANNSENVYCVKDNGVGFDMRYYDKLFGVFQRLHGADQFPGTGVGLAIVQRVVARHGGRVWAESAVDSGATFYFSLPKRTSGG